MGRLTFDIQNLRDSAMLLQSAWLRPCNWYPQGMTKRSRLKREPGQCGATNRGLNKFRRGLEAGSERSAHGGEQPSFLFRAEMSVTLRSQFGGPLETRSGNIRDSKDQLY